MTKRTIRVEIEADNRFPRLPPAHLHPPHLKRRPTGNEAADHGHRKKPENPNTNITMSSLTIPRSKDVIIHLTLALCAIFQPEVSKGCHAMG